MGREISEAPTTKAAAKVNVCHGEERTQQREIDLCTDVVEWREAGEFPSDCMHKHLTICWFMSTWLEVCA